jgi:Ca2+-binding EF-hand superfamily protein
MLGVRMLPLSAVSHAGRRLFPLSLLSHSCAPRLPASQSGTIDLGEFTKGMVHAFPTARDIDIEALFQEFDIDGGGTIQYDEMVRRAQADMDAPSPPLLPPPPSS